jgi:hypothetical protein
MSISENQASLEIVQKKYSTTCTFVFEEQRLAYTIKDSSGRHSFAMDYVETPSQTDELIENNAWFRNAGVFWLALGILQMVLRYTQAEKFQISLWLILGAGCLALYRIRRTTYSILNTEHGRIFIIQDSQHDRIMNELQDRRKKRLLSTLGDVNLTNDPGQEIAKFEWLRDQKVISDSEFKITRDAIVSHHGKTGSASGPPMLN